MERVTREVLNTLSFKLYGTASFWHTVMTKCLYNPKYHWARVAVFQPRNDCRQVRRHITDMQQYRAPTEQEMLEGMMQAYNARLEEQKHVTQEQGKTQTQETEASTTETL